MSVYMDLENVINIKNIPVFKENDLCDNMYTLYDYLLSCYEKTDLYKRNIALNIFESKMVTTSDEFYKLTGIHSLTLYPRGTDLVFERVTSFYCSTDILFYLYESFKNEFNFGRLDGFAFDILIDSFGEIDKNKLKSLDVDKEVLKHILNCHHRCPIEFSDVINENSILNYLGL